MLTTNLSCFTTVDTGVKKVLMHASLPILTKTQSITDHKAYGTPDSGFAWYPNTGLFFVCHAYCIWFKIAFSCLASSSVAIPYDNCFSIFLKNVIHFINDGFNRRSEPCSLHWHRFKIHPTHKTKYMTREICHHSARVW